MLSLLRSTAPHLRPTAPRLTPLPPLPLPKKMSTFTLSNTHPPVPVRLPPSLTRAQLLSFPAFTNWLSTLQHSLSLQRRGSHGFHDAPYRLRAIDVQAVDFFGGERVGFVKLRAEVANERGETLPGAVFLRGGSVAMMVSSEAPFLFGLLIWNFVSLVPIYVLYTETGRSAKLFN